jgi:predicted outer membrane repeat protein
MKHSKTRFIALLLAIITTLSVATSMSLTASALPMYPGNYKALLARMDNSKDDDEDELEEEEAFYKEDDTGLDFDLDVKDSLGEVMYEMIYRVIDHLADESWVGSVFAMGGLVVFKSIYDAVGLNKHEPSPDTEMILDAVDKLSEKVSENHDEAMKSLKKINANIDTQGFRQQADAIVSDYSEISKVLDASGVSSKETKGILSKSQYNAYKKALSARELDFSSIQKHYDNMEKFISGKSYTADKKAGYISYADYVVAKIDDENSSHDFNRSKDLATALKSIRKEVNSINNACILDCASVATIANMEYKIAEYEVANGIIEKDEENPPIKQLKKRLKQLDTTTKNMRKFYVKACKYIKNLGEAKVKFGNVEKTFSRFGDAWATAYKSGNKAVVTLIKNVKADGAKGLNTAGLGNDYGFNDQGGLLAKDGKTITLDLNNHTIDCSSKAFNFFNIDNTADVTLKNGTVKNATRAIHLDNVDKNITVGVNLDKMTITGCRDSALYFNTYNQTTLTLTNSAIKNTAKGSAIQSKWHLKYYIANTSFENNNGEYGAAIKASYAVDGSGVDKCSFKGNTAEKSGGALYNVYNVTNSTFSDNKANGGKGGAFCGWGSVTGCTFTGNSATDQGGAVWIQSNVKGCTFKNNRAGGNGGALFVQSKNKTVENCSFTNNSGSNGGALAYDLDGNYTKGCVFSGNVATYDGGGLYVPTDQDAKVECCRFENNKAGCDGGGVCVCAHTDLVLNVATFIGNSANNGGAAYLGALSANDHHFTSVTMTNNSARSHGGGLYANAGAFKAADIKLYGGIQIYGNGKENAYMVSDSAKKAVFKTTSTFDSGRSNVWITSSTNSDIAVVDLNAKAHEGAFHADNGRRIYRGTFHNYTLYLDKCS